MFWETIENLINKIKYEPKRLLTELIIFICFTIVVLLFGSWYISTIPERNEKEMTELLEKLEH